jgi:hypothetical protein
MKKFSLITAFIVGLAAIVTPAMAQELTTEQPQQPTLPRNAVVYHHELALTYGRLSVVEIGSMVTSSFGVLVTGHPIFSNYVGTIALAYKYQFDKVASLGVTYGYDSFKTDLYLDKLLMSKGYLTLNTLAVECDFRYLTRNSVTLYSTLGLGANIAYANFTTVRDDSKDSKLGVTYTGHISLLGAKIGSHRAGGVIEFGLGYKGLVNVGAYVRF